jgi:hypothetical protein
MIVAIELDKWCVVLTVEAGMLTPAELIKLKNNVV